MIFGLAWWAFIALVPLGIISIILAGYQKPFFAMFSLALGAGAILTLSGDIWDTVAWLTANWLIIGAGIVAYFVVGFLYTYLLRWQMHVNSDTQKELVAYRWKEYKRGKVGVTLEDFEKSSSYPYGFRHDFPIISTWILWWPVDLAWILCHDFLEYAFTQIGQKVAVLFAASAKNSVRKTLNGLD